MPVSVPTPTQLKAHRRRDGPRLTDADIDSFITLMKPSIEGYNVVDSLPNNLPPVKYPRTPGHRPGPEENKHNAWYYKSTVQGAPAGQAEGQNDRPEGQRHAGRRAHDERRLHPRGLHARGGRHHRDPDPRRRRHHPRQGALRVLLPLGRQPHQCHGGGAQPAQAGLLGRAAPRRAAPSSSPSARPTWPSAATRAAPSACRRRSAGRTG